MKKRLILLILGSAIGIMGCGSRPTTTITVAAKDPASVHVEPLSRRSPTFDADVAPILERSCLHCHDDRSKRGGIVLDGFVEGDQNSIDRVTWGRVSDVLRSGSMPPAGRARLEVHEREIVQEWINAEAFSCTVADQDPGRVTLRRLNRAEYDHTIRDLFGFDQDMKLAAAFPADDVGEGFDRIGDVLAIPPILMEKYLLAADRAIEETSRSSRVWSRLMNPQPDAIPPGLRKPTFAVRSEPIKRIGRPEPVAPVVEDPEMVMLRRAHEILRAFADKAFRRPATQEELTRLVGLVEAARKEGDDFDQAVRYALKAILISPHFLFLIEDGSATVESDRARPIDEFALASRLSYFLASRPPDDELYRLAVQGELRRGDHLAKQVRRMLRGENSRALVAGFVAQWLQIRALQDVTPDPKRFPDFDEPLRLAMIEETCRFALAIIHEDRSVLEFLDADFTFLNERLARHYGIGGVVGQEFRRVSLATSRRGGILSQASILTVTSNPTRTSPVKRGKWVLETILGLPPLPPPEGVEGLKAVDGASPSGTIRQQMERHRRDPACASCHARMDPIGFGLENFDAIGAWRTLDDGQPIDSSGTLPGGESFSGPSELREVLKSRSESFVRCLAEKLLTYALGRGLRPADRCFVDEIVRKTRRDGDRFSSLVQAIVESPPFQNRSGVKEEK
jgi:Protein of unknown function (DUF1592)/Protein of unknown function (DUF1588)/Protein of unknown function (DUF1585)/Protein of unknown function (DUF1595)/Protein of unknown function (DUF1587)